MRIGLWVLDEERVVELALDEELAIGVSEKVATYQINV